ncbi:NADH-quinone oxidoreductase subunit N [Phenylobacterium sp. Root77]|jgi:NADH-quinone oxidoreductase subunit N|uniref:NADH-quinone oxidoreductase subunit NuoN n=1 Tax=unclassified Phenylobacterium TaxID=2640670 RepID=UPI0006F6B69F|nr:MULTISPECIES: NADH-quinone oxidoreductase subunit NuoN [unclassified Phenylobacterium]KQW71535.1 NADH-quinone oxidoreductase subunit N [Phenylobacterium sp. Root1277]KQW94455.1 NADH-quinone oxidoreductase subunit N [Phenylobacterium sp. Root1290]KRC44149.1 NADH-quinone oxidoreductase subunit N [Phenylobacterium sp. Root77]
MTFSQDLALAAPELILAIGALGLLVVGAFAPRATTALMLASIGALILAAWAAAVGPIGRGFSGGLIADNASAFAKVAIYLASAVAILLGQKWFERKAIRNFEFPILILLAALGMGMMASAGDLISLYMGVELHSLALYVLAAMHREDAKASEAGLKYFVLGALSSGLLLYGASLIYGFAGSTKFDEIAAVVQGGASTGVLFGLVFLICGLAFKVSAAPFHMWTPDVYEGAPTPVVAFFAGAPKLAAMVLFARVLAEGFAGAADQWRQVLVLIALLSIFVGAFAGLAQTNLKRLWAYSSIANVGYAVLGLASGSSEGMQAMLVFMVLYMIDVTGFFACLTALSRNGRPMETIGDMAGLFKERPGIALAMTAFSLSALGLPPFSGFWAKFYVFKAALGVGEPMIVIAAVLGLVGSVVAAFYYLRLIKVMWFDTAPGQTDALPREAQVVAISAALFSFPVVMGALIFLDPAAKAAAAAFGLAS